LWHWRHQFRFLRRIRSLRWRFFHCHRFANAHVLFRRRYRLLTTTFSRRLFESAVFAGHHGSFVHHLLLLLFPLFAIWFLLEARTATAAGGRWWLGADLHLPLGGATSRRCRFRHGLTGFLFAGGRGRVEEAAFGTFAKFTPFRFFFHCVVGIQFRLQLL
jgi:hypothetical protein